MYYICYISDIIFFDFQAKHSTMYVLKYIILWWLEGLENFTERNLESFSSIYFVDCSNYDFIFG